MLGRITTGKSFKLQKQLTILEVGIWKKKKRKSEGKKLMKSRKERIAVPKETERKLLVESGHKCSVPFCNESNAISIHHINGDPTDNRESNLIVFCRNHHVMADSGRIDRKECVSYKQRLKLTRPEETLKEKVEREGISVTPESDFVKFVLNLGRRYMMWRYGKPTASINREITALGVSIILCFVPFFYMVWFLRAQITTEWIYFSTIFVIVGSFLLIVFMVIFKRRCPKCKGYFGIERIDSKKVSTNVTETETQTRIETVYRNTYRCAYCSDTNTLNEPEEEIIQKNQYS